MDLHEYQAKAILQEYGIPLQTPHMVFKPSDISKVLAQFKDKTIVAKVQVHAGGRGKAGGVKVIKEEHKKKEIIEKLLNKPAKMDFPQAGFLLQKRVASKKSIT